MPNIKGYTRTGYLKKDSVSEKNEGALKISDYGPQYNGYTSGTNTYMYAGVSFTASEGQIYTKTSHALGSTDHYTTEEGYTDYQIYGQSNTVQPPAIRVYAWKRTI